MLNSFLNLGNKMCKVLQGMTIKSAPACINCFIEILRKGKILSGDCESWIISFSIIFGKETLEIRIPGVILRHANS